MQRGNRRHLLCWSALAAAVLCAGLLSYATRPDGSGDAVRAPRLHVVQAGDPAKLDRTLRAAGLLDAIKSGALQAVPRVGPETPMHEALLEMTSKRLGFTGVFDSEGLLVGVLTDGDLRRGLGRAGDFLERRAREMMTVEPKAVPMGTLGVQALRLMEEHAITSLFVLESKCSARVVGAVHIHDLVKAGLQ